MTSYIDPAWLAGFFDGEGSVGLYTSRRRTQIHLSVTLAQKSRLILELILLTYPGGRLHQLKSSIRDKEHLTWALVYSGRNAEAILQSMLPHSKIKKSQIEMALQFISTLQPKVSFGRGYTKMPLEVVALREKLMVDLKSAKRVTVN